MEITSKPLALDEIDRKVLQLEMERLSLSKAPGTDRAAKGRLAALDRDLEGLKSRQAKLNEQWEAERDDMQRLQSIREEVDRVNLEIQQAERDYDLNRAAELKYGTLINLQKQLKEVEADLQMQESSAKMLREEVTEADVSDIISRWTGAAAPRCSETTYPRHQLGLVWYGGHVGSRLVCLLSSCCGSPRVGFEIRLLLGYSSLGPGLGPFIRSSG